MQEDNHIFQGLRRDNHQIRQDEKFLWNAHNIRLTNRDNSTLLSITNERGTLDTGLSFEGFYVGHCVLNEYLVVFTANDDNTDTYIYRVEKTDTGYKTIILFHEEEVWEKAWNPNYPIEAIGVYETGLVQKVYWVDGHNQPRVINIVLNKLRGIDDSDIEDMEDLTEKLLYNTTSFDFVGTLDLKEDVEITKIYGSGQFSPGTVQYAFSYYNKYGQESNIFYTTPLYYISPQERGGNPEEKVANSFKIQIWGAEYDKFDYIRIYSIHRTSIDAVPTVKIVSDVKCRREDPGEVVSFIDTGTTGSTIDPTQLLYIGGESIIASTLCKKDGTLFLGNITLNRESQREEIKRTILDNNTLEDLYIDSSSSSSSSSSYYDYTPSLGEYSAMFMPGETYRCGIQVQYSNGKWSDPIHFDDIPLATKNAWENPLRESKSIVLHSGNKVSEKLRQSGVRRIRSCIVFPKAYERNIICQGVLCPTVYGVAGRRNDLPYASSSWFFRPAVNLSAVDNSSDIYHGATIQFQHNKALFTGADRGAEIQSMLSGADSIDSVTSDNVDKYNSHFFVDENIVTFHSPDLEFDTAMSEYNWKGVSLRIVGMAKLGAISGDIDIQTSSPVAFSKSPGFIHTPIGYQTRNNYSINGGLVMGSFYRDYSLKEDFTTHSDLFWAVYPWHRSGSLNNDTRRPSDKGTQSAVLSKKKISNLKFFDKNTSLGAEPIDFDISTPMLFSSNEVSLLKITPSYLRKEVPYFGNVDSLLTIGKDEYPLYAGQTSETLAALGTGLIANSSDPVRLKYKSTPHLVFSLGDSANDIPLLPRHASIGGTLNGSFTFPGWQNTGSSDGSNDDKGQYNFKLKLYTSGAINNYYPTPPDYAVGSCSIGSLGIGSDGQKHMYVAKAEAASSGNIWMAMTKEYSGDLILKAEKNFTMVYKSDNYLPGTDVSDYDRGMYIGKDRYYKVNFSDEYPGTVSSIEEITDSVSRSIDSRSIITYQLSQKSFGDKDSGDGETPYLLIGELVRDNVINKFGGNSAEAIRQNLWIPAGRPVSIPTQDADIVIPFEYGDTWYARYDCLKTYPFTQEDENQIVEIGSFMCETRVNIDGRYDRNRGQVSNLNMTPQNFNLLNEVYSQKDNFFNYRVLDEDYYKQNTFANQVTWSKEKSAGEEIDTWTNITLANTLDMDGEKGGVTALRAWNEFLLCFQEKALNQILFNSRAQIPVSDGVPIEISNGYKVDGSRLLANNIGCNNKWSITTTPAGAYFLDSNTNDLYVFNGQLVNLSEDRGMSWWVQQNHVDKIWNSIPYNKGIPNGIRTFYDARYGDVYFTPGPVDGIEQPDALCYSEKLGQFTSLMSYGGTQAMFNFNNGFYSLRESGNERVVRLYQNNIDDYNNFYGETKGWDFSFISNQNPTLTKIFDTVDLRTDHYLANSTQPLNSCPVNYIKVDNEYQHTGTVALNNINMRKKFRVWRGTIPRSSKVASLYSSHFLQDGSDVNRAYGRARIRNPWAMITLGWNPDTTKGADNNKKVVVHDVSVKYTV